MVGGLLFKRNQNIKIGGDWGWLNLTGTMNITLPGN